MNYNIENFDTIKILANYNQGHPGVLISFPQNNKLRFLQYAILAVALPFGV